MNEREIERLMNVHGEDLGSCSKVPLPRRGNVFWRRGSIALAAGLVLGASVLLLLPRDAGAQALRRVGKVLRNMKSVEVVGWAQTRGGKWNLVAKSYYRDGMWRGENRWGGRQNGYSILRDGKVLTYNDDLGYALIAPSKPVLKSKYGTPSEDKEILQWVMDSTDYRATSEERQINLVDSEPVHGKPTYKIVLDRVESYYHAEIVVEKGTDLPISAEYQIPDHRYASHRQEYRFNAPLPDSLFTFDIKAPVIDLLEEEEKLAREWQATLVQRGTTSIKDVCVTNDGTVWIASTLADMSWIATAPSWIRTNAAGEYIRLYDRAPGYRFKQPVLIDGEAVMITGFLPLTPSASLPKSLELGFAKRHTEFVPVAMRVKEVPLKGSVKLAIRREARPWPSYFMALDLDNQGQRDIGGLPKERAREFEKRSAWLDAAKWYEESARLFGASGWVEYRDSARCYELAGRTQEAKRVQAISDKFKKDLGIVAN